MGHPLNAIERALVERHIRDHCVTRCPPCRRGTLPHLRPETAVDRMRRLWRSRLRSSGRHLAGQPRMSCVGTGCTKTGLSFAAIGCLVGRDGCAIWEAFKRQGLPMRPKRGAPGWRKAS
jgi:hypothetical protein